MLKQVLRLFAKPVRAGVPLALLLAACGGPSGGCPVSGGLPLVAVALVYPVPGTAVSPNVGEAIFSSAAREPIELVGRRGSIPTTARALPSPLPNPMGTPLPGSSLFAVSFGALSPGTKYQTFAVENQPFSCMRQPAITVKAGSFRTR